MTRSPLHHIDHIAIAYCVVWTLSVVAVELVKHLGG